MTIIHKPTPVTAGIRSSAPVAKRLEDHPTATLVRRRGPASAPERLTAEQVRAIALDAGADDAGVVSLDHPDLAEERASRPRGAGRRTLARRRRPSHARRQHPKSEAEYLESSVPPRRPRGRRGPSPDRGGPLFAGAPEHQPLDGLSHGDGELSRSHLGRVAQARRRRGRAREDGASQERHPSPLRVVHPPRHRRHHRRHRRPPRASVVQSVRELQTLRRRLSGRRDRARRGVSLFGLLRPQLPRVHVGLRRRARGGRRQSRSPRSERPGLAIRERVDLAEPRLRAQLQGRLLHRRLPCRRRLLGTDAREPTRPPRERGEASHRQRRDRLCRRRLGRGSTCEEAVSAQEGARRALEPARVERALVLPRHAARPSSAAPPGVGAVPSISISPATTTYGRRCESTTARSRSKTGTSASRASSSASTASCGSTS